MRSWCGRTSSAMSTWARATARRRSVGTEEIGLAVMATTFAICAVFVPVAFMKGIVGKFFFPFGITVAVAVLVSLFVSFTLDPMLSSIWRDPPTNRLLKVPVLGHLMRGTDRLLDVLHGIYERLIHWIFSGRHYRVLVPPIPAWGRPFGADGQRDRQRAAALALRHGHAAGAGAARRHRQLRRRDRCWRRWSAPSSSRRPTTATSSMNVDAAGRHQPGARQREAAPGRGDRRARCPRSGWSRPPSATPATASATRPSSAIQLDKPSERKRSQKQVEKALRTALKPIPGIERLARQPADLRRAARPRPERARDRGAAAARQGRQGAAASPT